MHDRAFLRIHMLRSKTFTIRCTIIPSNLQENAIKIQHKSLIKYVYFCRIPMLFKQQYNGDTNNIKKNTTCRIIRIAIV